MERYFVQPIRRPGQKRPSAYAVVAVGATEILDAYRSRELAEAYVAYANGRR